MRQGKPRVPHHKQEHRSPFPVTSTQQQLCVQKALLEKMGQQPQPHKSGPWADGHCDFILTQPTFRFALASGGGLGCFKGHLLRVTVHFEPQTPSADSGRGNSHSSTAVPPARPPIPASLSHSFQQLGSTLEPLIPSIQTTFGQRIK